MLLIKRMCLVLNLINNRKEKSVKLKIVSGEHNLFHICAVNYKLPKLKNVIVMFIFSIENLHLQSSYEMK